MFSVGVGEYSSSVHTAPQKFSKLNENKFEIKKKSRKKCL